MDSLSGNQFQTGSPTSYGNNYGPLPQQYQQQQQDSSQKTKKKTQDEQDKDDEKARQKAQEQLVQSWMDRLQLVSVITTFFAANEAQLLSITTPQDNPNNVSKILQTANAMLASSLVLHSFSAVIAFVGAFVLVNYKLKEEKKEEHKTADKAEKGSNAKPNTDDGLYSTNPRLEQSSAMGWGRWGSSSGGPPTELLKSAHGIAIGTAFVGFIFAVAGIVCYVWAQQSRSVSIFSSATLGACILISLTVVNPLKRAEKSINGPRKH